VSKKKLVKLDPILIGNASELEALCADIRETGWFAFDTEFVGEDQFRPEVCLIQVALIDEVYLIDPLSKYDVTPIWELLADASIEKIVHAGPEDVAQSWHELDKPPRNVIDTQLAAGFVGVGYPVSLSRLVRMTLNKRMHKSQTLSDWRQRPLGKDQIQYAAEDVVHLQRIRDKLIRKTDKLGRTDWLRAECDAMCAASEPTQDQEQKLRRLKGAGSLSRHELAIAYAILDERESLAIEYNRPVRTVIKDHIVVELARRAWTDPGKLRSIRGLNISNAAVARVAKVVEEALKIPEAEWPELPSREDLPEEDALIDLLTAVLKDWCLQNEMSYGLLSKKQTLRNLVRTRTRPDDAEDDTTFTDGWRAECVGGLLADLLDGKAEVRVVLEENERRVVASRLKSSD